MGRVYINIDHTRLGLTTTRRSTNCVLVTRHIDKGKSGHARGMMGPRYRAALAPNACWWPCPHAQCGHGHQRKFLDSYESAEPSESWMTVLQHHGVFGTDAVPAPPLVSYFHRPPTENGTSSQKSKHVCRCAITVATRPSADPTADDAVRDREVVPPKGGRSSRPPLASVLY